MRSGGGVSGCPATGFKEKWYRIMRDVIKIILVLGKLKSGWLLNTWQDKTYFPR